MIRHEVDSIKGLGLKETQAEFNNRDYRLLKQIEKIPEVRELLEAEYPGELKWREEMREKINELRGEKKEGSVEEEEEDELE